MLLRIEDTDRERSTDAAITAIIDGLEWLGLKWDGDTIYQFARADRHREVAEAMLAKGAAYNATPARRNWRRCAISRARKGVRRAMTDAGATGGRRRRPMPSPGAQARGAPEGAARRARP